MSIYLRLLLIIGSLLASIYAVRKIRKSQMKIENAIYWFGFSALTIFFSFFPNIAILLATLIGIESPANFIYLIMIFLLIVKVFSLTVKNSQLENKLSVLIQEVAIWRNELEK